jgi:glutamate-ammonia-ligase adenylyltransferase
MGALRLDQGARSDRRAARELDAIVRPFVFRKYLDYATLARDARAARRGAARRRAARARRARQARPRRHPRDRVHRAGAAADPRRARPELHARPTLQVSGVLRRKNLLPRSAATSSRRLRFLRNVEHRLQYLDDAQRHDLPEDGEDRARVARMCGFASWHAFAEQLEAIATR